MPGSFGLPLTWRSARAPCILIGTVARRGAQRGGLLSTPGPPDNAIAYRHLLPTLVGLKNHQVLLGWRKADLLACC